MPVEPAGESGGTLRAFWLGEPASLEGDVELAWPSPPSPLFKILTPPQKETPYLRIYIQFREPKASLGAGLPQRSRSRGLKTGLRGGTTSVP